jgi:hypothetical protein
VGAISQKKEYDYICTKQRNTHMKYKRILLKLSGEALMGDRQYGIDPVRLAEYAAEIKQIHDKGIEIAIVIGGKYFRGVAGASNGMDRVQETTWNASNSDQRNGFARRS